MIELDRFIRRLCSSLVTCAALAAGSAGPAGAADPELSLISIATGGRTGVYYFAGGAICARVNEHRWTHGIRCVVEETGGSIDNLRALRSNTATFAIVQSDWHHSAIRGTGIFEAFGADWTLRSVFSIYPEAFTVVAGRESGITRFTDLLGKRVNVGPPGSGSRATMEVVMEAVGWDPGEFESLSAIDSADVVRALCDGEIDAAVFTIAHPNLAVEDMLTTCGASLVPVDGPGIDTLIEENAFYFEGSIFGETYPGQREAVPVFALAATLVTSARTPPATVYELVKAVFGDLAGFRATHPAFAELTAEQMTTNGLSAPLHSGALRYFEETGLR